MTQLRLSKLPDRTPVKLSVSFTPELFQRLQEYANAYAEVYEVQEPIVELIPAMLTAFLDSDRSFSRRGRG